MVRSIPEIEQDVRADASCLPGCIYGDTPHALKGRRGFSLITRTSYAKIEEHTLNPVGGAIANGLWAKALKCQFAALYKREFRD